MARSLTRGAAAIVLRRNLRYAAVECPHSALLEALTLEELLPALHQQRRMFNVIEAMRLVGALETASLPLLNAVVADLLHCCSGVAQACYRTMEAIAAYGNLAAQAPPQLLLPAITRLLNGNLVAAAATAATAPDDAATNAAWQHVRFLAIAGALLHAYLVCNQHSAAFCEAVGEAESRTQFALVRSLLDCLTVSVEAPTWSMPTRKILLSLRALMKIALLGRYAAALVHHDAAMPYKPPPGATTPVSGSKTGRQRHGSVDTALPTGSSSSTSASRFFADTTSAGSSGSERSGAASASAAITDGGNGVAGRGLRLSSGFTTGSRHDPRDAADAALVGPPGDGDGALGRRRTRSVESQIPAATPTAGLPSRDSRRFFGSRSSLPPPEPTMTSAEMELGGVRRPPPTLSGDVSLPALAAFPSGSTASASSQRSGTAASATSLSAAASGRGLATAPSGFGGMPAAAPSLRGRRAGSGVGGAGASASFRRREIIGDLRPDSGGVYVDGIVADDSEGDDSEGDGGDDAVGLSRGGGDTARSSGRDRARVPPLSRVGSRRRDADEGSAPAAAAAAAAPVGAEWKQDVAVIRRCRECYVGLLTGGGTNRWPELMADLLALLLAAMPNLREYTGKVRLYTELAQYQHHNLYAGSAVLGLRATVGDTSILLPLPRVVPRGPPIVAVAEAPASSSIAAPATASIAIGASGGDGGEARLPEQVASLSHTRHRDIIARACTDLMLFLVRTMTVGHPLHGEHLTSLLEKDCAAVLVLKFITQDLPAYLMQSDVTCDVPCSRFMDAAFSQARATADKLRQRIAAMSRRRGSNAMASPAPSAMTPTSTARRSAPSPTATAGGLSRAGSSASVATPSVGALSTAGRGAEAFELHIVMDAALALRRSRASQSRLELRAGGSPALTPARDTTTPAGKPLAGISPTLASHGGDGGGSGGGGGAVPVLHLSSAPPEHPFLQLARRSQHGTSATLPGGEGALKTSPTPDGEGGGSIIRLLPTRSSAPPITAALADDASPSSLLTPPPAIGAGDRSTSAPAIVSTGSGRLAATAGGRDAPTLLRLGSGSAGASAAVGTRGSPSAAGSDLSSLIASTLMSPKTPTHKTSPTHPSTPTGRPMLDMSKVSESLSGPATDVGPARGARAGMATGTIHSLTMHAESSHSGRASLELRGLDITGLDDASSGAGGGLDGGAFRTGGSASGTTMRTRSSNLTRGSSGASLTPGSGRSSGGSSPAASSATAAATGSGSPASLRTGSDTGARPAPVFAGTAEDGLVAAAPLPVLEEPIEPSHILLAGAGLTRADAELLSEKRRREGRLSADLSAGDDARSVASASTTSSILGTRAAQYASTGYPLHGQMIGGCVDLVSGAPLSRRRVAIVTDLLRILISMIKRKDFRTLHLVNTYRPHPVLQTTSGVDAVPVMIYALKLMKPMLRHLGLWKRRSMGIISAIYHFLPPTPGEVEWLLTPGLAEALRLAREAGGLGEGMSGKALALALGTDNSGVSRPWMQRARSRIQVSARSTQVLVNGVPIPAAAAATSPVAAAGTASSRPRSMWGEAGRLPRPCDYVYDTAEALAAAIAQHNAAITARPFESAMYASLLPSPGHAAIGAGAAAAPRERRSDGSVTSRWTGVVASPPGAADDTNRSLFQLPLGTQQVTPRSSPAAALSAGIGDGSIGSMLAFVGQPPSAIPATAATIVAEAARAAEEATAAAFAAAAFGTSWWHAPAAAEPPDAATAAVSERGHVGWRLSVDELLGSGGSPWPTHGVETVGPGGLTAGNVDRWLQLELGL